MVLGDARLTLALAPDRKYRLIVLDVFSSDSVPVHLINREALALYLAKLKPGGALVFNITNPYLDLVPVVGALVRSHDLVGYFRGDTAVEPELQRFSSGWAIMARQITDLGSLPSDPRWIALDVVAAGRSWDDDFSNIVGALRW